MTDKWRSFLAGILAAVGVSIVGALVIAGLGLVNVGADTQEGALARAYMIFTRERSVAAQARKLKVPPFTPQMVEAGAHEYAEMCVSCHLGPGMADSELRQGLNPRPPQFWRSGEGDPREDFWVIKHGIRMTAMPAWGITHDDDVIWSIVAFLPNLAKMKPEECSDLVEHSSEHGAHHHADEHAH